jgi:hypothetical protein
MAGPNLYPMSTKRKRLQAVNEQKLKIKPTFRLRIIALGGIGLFVILAAAYILTKGDLFGTKDTPIVPKEISKESPASNLFQRTVQRAYAVDKLFHQVYNAEWEGANGAIGDAYLYAATGDKDLLSLYTNTYRLLDMHNGTWVDDRAWICLAEMYWWDMSGRKNVQWVDDTKNRYLEAKREGRLSHHEGFWSWYNYAPNMQGNFRIFTNSNMNQMATVACWLYEATHEQQFYIDAMLVWNGDTKYPGVEKQSYRGNGKWQGNEGQAAFGKQFPWEGAGMCAIGAAMFRMTGEAKYKKIAVETARRIMDPASGWIDSNDYYQLRMDGNGAFVHFILDAYQIAPDQLTEIPGKIEKMLEHVWTNHHGDAAITLHRLWDDGIRNGWNPNGGEDGYKVDEVGTVHPQSQAIRAFGVFAYVLYTQNSTPQK